MKGRTHHRGKGKSREHATFVHQARSNQELPKNINRLPMQFTIETNFNFSKNPTLTSAILLLLILYNIQPGEAKRDDAEKNSPNTNSLAESSTRKIQIKLEERPILPPVAFYSKHPLNLSKKEQIKNEQKFKESIKHYHSQKLCKKRGDYSHSSSGHSPKPVYTPNFNEHNWVLIRVWLPVKKDSDGNLIFTTADGSDNVGHVSIETKNMYASFWPLQKKKDWNIGGAIIGAQDGILHTTPEVDCFSEEGTPDIVIPLYSLDVRKMKLAFSQFERSSVSKKWSLFGKNSFNALNAGAGESCSGLAHDLLEAGGIFKRLRVSTYSNQNLAYTPSAIARLVISAAQYERKHFPITKNFAKPFDTPVRIPRYIDDYNIRVCNKYCVEIDRISHLRK